jgi:uncharacterized protein YjbJ (UPF0337 family)
VLKRKIIMDEDRIDGIANQVKGEVKQTVGDVFGDAKLSREGHADKLAGSLQNFAGSLKDTARSVYDQAPESLKTNLNKTVDVIKANPALASLAVATFGGLATWYAASHRKDS